MSKLPHSSKISRSRAIQWEVIKNCEYNNGYLFKILNLYLIKMSFQSDTCIGDRLGSNTILIRVSVTSASVFLNKAVDVEIMEDIFPRKFNSRKRNNVSRLEDLYCYVSSIVGDRLPEELSESLVKEYKDAVKLFKAIT